MWKSNLTLLLSEGFCFLDFLWMRPVSTPQFVTRWTCLGAFASSFSLLFFEIPAVMLCDELSSSGSKSMSVAETFAREGLNVKQILLLLSLSFGLWLDSSSMVLFLLTPNVLVFEPNVCNFSFALLINSLIIFASRGRGRKGKYACANGCIRSWLVLVTTASCQLLCAVLGPRLSPNTSYSCWYSWKGFEARPVELDRDRDFATGAGRWSTLAPAHGDKLVRRTGCELLTWKPREVIGTPCCLDFNRQPAACCRIQGIHTFKRWRATSVSKANHSNCISREDCLMKSSLNQDNLVNWFDSTNNVNWPPLGVSKLTFRALALRHSLRRRTNARNVSFETLNDDQFMLPNYLVILSHWRSTTDSLETYPLYWIKPRSKPYSIFLRFFWPQYKPMAVQENTSFSVVWAKERAPSIPKERHKLGKLLLAAVHLIGCCRLTLAEAVSNRFGGVVSHTALRPKIYKNNLIQFFVFWKHLRVPKTKFLESDWLKWRKKVMKYCPQTRTSNHSI